MNKRNKGFTLIELLIVIAIIGILSSIVIASLNSARKKARDSRRVADIKQVQLALEMYFDANTKYPTALSALVTGGQIASEPKDPVSAASYTYSYYPAVSPTYYHLGADLEETTNSAFGSDKDCDSSIAGTTCGAGAAYTGGFNGILGTCAQSAGTDSCYDVVP